MTRNWHYSIECRLNFPDSEQRKDPSTGDSKRIVDLLFGFLGNVAVQFPDVSEERSTSIFMVRFGFKCILNWLEKEKVEVILQINCKTPRTNTSQIKSSDTKPINTLKPDVKFSSYLAGKKGRIH
jgi:hypothetical protein